MKNDKYPKFYITPSTVWKVEKDGKVFIKILGSSEGWHKPYFYLTEKDIFHPQKQRNK